jgi:hypothetical protein
MLFNKVISRGENFPIPRGMPLRFDANGKKSPRNRLEEMLFCFIAPNNAKSTLRHIQHVEYIRDWSNAAHEPTHTHLNGFVYIG